MHSHADISTPTCFMYLLLNFLYMLVGRRPVVGTSHVSGGQFCPQLSSYITQRMGFTLNLVFSTGALLLKRRPWSKFPVCLVMMAKHEAEPPVWHQSDVSKSIRFLNLPDAVLCVCTVTLYNVRLVYAVTLDTKMMHEKDMKGRGWMHRFALHGNIKGHFFGRQILVWFCSYERSLRKSDLRKMWEWFDCQNSTFFSCWA